MNLFRYDIMQFLTSAPNFRGGQLTPLTWPSRAPATNAFFLKLETICYIATTTVRSVNFTVHESDSMSSGGEISFAQHSVVEFKQQGCTCSDLCILPRRCYTGGQVDWTAVVRHGN